MKDTPLLREWVNEQVNKYYKQIGVNRLPQVYFSREEMPSKFHSQFHVKQYKKFAAVSLIGKDRKHPHCILINVPYHRSYRELENTIAHEMMHIRFPNLEHSDEWDESENFFTILGMILQGKHYNKSPRKKKS